MSVRPGLFALCLVLAGCGRNDAHQTQANAAATPQAAAGQATAVPAPIDASPKARTHGFASLADRGELIAYPGHVRREDGAYTWVRADLSEAHALHAIAGGHLRVTTPDGQLLDVRYDRHVEHPSGDWTWIGHLEGHEGEQTILTFGDKAAFGSIAQPGKLPLRLTVRDGVSWLVETDPRKVAAIVNAATRPQRPDYHIVGKDQLPHRSDGTHAAADTKAVGTGASITAAAATATTAASTVDLLVGYTPGFASANGSAALTRINYLVEVANAAYANSRVDARLRLVKAMPVTYTDDNSNETALEQMSGYESEGGEMTPAAAFNGLRAAREQYGADLVALIRDFRDPENDGCGIAWLLGGGLQGIGAGDGWDALGYSVVSDGTDAGTDGKNYFCRDESLAHELGHSMGAAHDKTAAEGDDGTLDNPDDYGAYTYSFGYKTGSTTGNFYTVMAYGDSGQRSYRTFSTPLTTFCGGRACGTSSQDNARTLEETVPVVASFRSGSSSDLYVIKKQGARGTELHVLGAESGFQSFVLHAATALGDTGSNGAWSFRRGDYDHDGISDIYVIKKMGSSGKTEVHVLDGADYYRSYLLHVAIALGRTGTDESWVFDLGDFNQDGTLDLYVIKRHGSSGRTELHVLDGADRFQRFLMHAASALPATLGNYAWKFDFSDYNHDGVLDLYVIKKNGSSGFTEIHVLNGADQFRSFLLHRATPLAATGTDNAWEFKVGDYDGNGSDDLFVIKKQGRSGRTEVHVLDGSTGFRSYSAHIATALSATGSDGAWDFDL